MHMSKVGNFENNDGVYKTLLESTKAIPWKIYWASMKFSYIGPQIEALLGWSADSWVSVEDWAMRMHPDDRERVVNFCVTQSQAGIDHEADYRALTRTTATSGSATWCTWCATARVRRRRYVGFMFDISERKKTEEKLLSLQKELEVLSFKDGLTNIANRRSFDAHFETAWEQAQRLNSSPCRCCSSMWTSSSSTTTCTANIQGDSCLIDIAQMLKLALDGPRDLVARYGGEEFIAPLPGANAEVAHQGGRASPAPDPEKIHRARTDPVQPARDRRRRCGYRRAPDEAALAHRFPECRRPAVLYPPVAPWPQPD